MVLFWVPFTQYIHLGAVPATSAAIEREFSLAGNNITKKRSRLFPNTVNDIIFQNSLNRYKKKNMEQTHTINELVS